MSGRLDPPQGSTDVTAEGSAGYSIGLNLPSAAILIAIICLFQGGD
ncbi:hypothetical protein IFO70_29795 [Phormidium tenue FACHB-886]|nr:hypothetical protein [Phormidium tenue FACHB-886]